MATKPNFKPEFASDDVTLPVAQTDNKIRPTEPTRLNGYDRSQKPPVQEINWMFDNIHDWVNYFEEVTDDIGVTEIATQAEAEAGTDNSKIMTSLRTRQSMQYYMNLYGLDGKARELSPLTDMKTVTDSGLYIISSASDRPSGTTIGFLEVINYDDGANSRCHQRFHSMLGDVGTWTRQQLWSSGNFSQWSRNWEETLTLDSWSSIDNRGYQKLPSGLIIQYGRYGSSIPALTTRSFNFPLAFPNEVYSITLTAIDTGDQAKAQVTGYDTEGVSIRSGNDNLQDVFFMAIGR